MNQSSTEHDHRCISLHSSDPPKSVSVSVSPSGDITTGSMVLLTCSSDANPPTSSRNYTWYKAGVHIARGRSMRFSHFGLEDDGEYECKSENAYGAKLSEPVALLLSCKAVKQSKC